MAFLGFQSCRLPARKPSKTLQTLQNPPNPPNTVPSRHLRSTAGVDLVLFQTLQTFTLKQLPPGTPGPGPQQWLSMSFQSCRLPARKGSKRLQNSKPPGPGPQQWDFLWISKLPFASPQRLQTFQNKIPNTFPNRHPRAKATSPTGTPGPGHSNGFLRLSKLPFASPQTLQNSPNPPNPQNPPNPPNTGTSIHPGPCPLPNPPNPFLKQPSPAGPQNQGHSNGPCPLPNPPNLYQTLQSTASPTGTPGPGPQQWLSMSFQSCRLPARKGSKRLQNSKHLPQQAPQGQGHSNETFLWAFKAAVCQPAKAPNFPPKFQNLRQQAPQGQTPRPQQAPQGPQQCGPFLWISKLPFASPQRLQTFQNKASKPFPNRHLQGQGQTSPTGTPGPGHSNDFLMLSKLPFASPQTLQKASPTGTPRPLPKGPQQWLS